MKNTLAVLAFGCSEEDASGEDVYVVSSRRHVERQKPSQKPTKWGEVAAFAMGMEERRQGFIFDSATSSPQERAIYTAEILMRGAASLNGDEEPITIVMEHRLNDFSSDQRDEVRPGFLAGKAYATETGLEPEVAMFLCLKEEVQQALHFKTAEFVETVDDLGNLPGRHLLTCHGCSIDGACITLIQRLAPDKSFALTTHGGLFDKVEGFDAYYRNGKLIRLEVIRLPKYLKALEDMME